MAIKRERIERTVILMDPEWSDICRKTGISPSNEDMRKSLFEARKRGLDVPVIMVDNTLNLMRQLLEGEVEFIF